MQHINQLNATINFGDSVTRCSAEKIANILLKIAKFVAIVHRQVF